MRNDKEGTGILTVASGTSISSPLRITRAVFGARPSSCRMAALVRPRARRNEGGFVLDYSPGGVWIGAAAFCAIGGALALVVEGTLPARARRTPVPVAA